VLRRHVNVSEIPLEQCASRGNEAVVGLLFTAISTGLVFAKFTRDRPMIDFANHATIAPMNGQPTLVIRVGNMRGNLIIDATALCR